MLYSKPNTVCIAHGWESGPLRETTLRWGRLRWDRVGISDWNCDKRMSCRCSWVHGWRRPMQNACRYHGPNAFLILLVARPPGVGVGEGVLACLACDSPGSWSLSRSQISYKIKFTSPGDCNAFISYWGCHRLLPGWSRLATCLNLRLVFFVKKRPKSPG